MEEIWKDIEGYEGYYQVSNMGRVKSLDREVRVWNRFEYTNRRLKSKIIACRIDAHGYLSVHLHKNKHCKVVEIQRLVANAFIPNPENKPQVNHIDGNKQNNCVSNLEWNTCSENMLHAYKNKLANARRGKDNSLSKQVIQYDKNMREIANYGSAWEASRKTGYSQTSISDCCRKKQKNAHGYIWRYKEE